MLREITNTLDNPSDIPAISKSAISYLQSRFNADYVAASGEMDTLKTKGYSEAVILGFIMGLQHATSVLDDMEYIRSLPKEE